MKAQTLVNEINRKVNGEYEVVEFESDDWNTIVSTLNENIDLYNKATNWRSSYDPMYSVGTVDTSVYYKLKLEDIASIDGSDRMHVLFYDSNNEIVRKYKLVAQDIFDQSGDNDEVVTINSKGIQIKPKTATDDIYGCNMVLPVFRNVAPVSRLTDTVEVDDIYWLIIKTAADITASSPVGFIARNYDTFNQQAETRLKDMKKANRISQAPTTAYSGWNPATRPDGR